MEDPSGAGRRRLVDYTTGTPGGTQVMTGSVRWGAVEESGAQQWVGAPGHGGGRVVMSTTNAPLTFEL